MILDQLGENPFGRYRYLYLPLYAISFIFTFKVFRDKYNQHKLRPQQGLLIGLLLTLVTSGIHSLMLGAYLQGSNQGESIVLKHKKASIDRLEKAAEQLQESIGKEEIEKVFSSLQKLSAQDIALDQGLSMLIWGIVLTFLFMLIFKN